MKAHRTEQEIPTKILKAIDHVREFFPKVCIVIYNLSGRWQYLTEDFDRPSFEDVSIDIGILEDAVNSVNYPAIFQPYTFEQ